MAEISRTTLALGTGATALTVDQLVPPINWILSGFPADSRPPEVAVLLAVGLLVLASLGFHFLKHYLQVKDLELDRQEAALTSSTTTGTTTP